MSFLNCDFAEPWQVGFQDPATPVMEGIVDFFHQSSFYLVLVIVVVGWIICAALLNFQKAPFSHKYWNEGTFLEIVWTLIPAVILISIALPSFKLLYFADEVIDPALTIKAIGRQWYWSYEYSDYSKEDESTL